MQTKPLRTSTAERIVENMTEPLSYIIAFRPTGRRTQYPGTQGALARSLELCGDVIRLLQRWHKDRHGGTQWWTKRTFFAWSLVANLLAQASYRSEDVVSVPPFVYWRFGAVRAFPSTTDDQQLHAPDIAEVRDYCKRTCCLDLPSERIAAHISSGQDLISGPLAGQPNKSAGDVGPLNMARERGFAGIRQANTQRVGARTLVCFSAVKRLTALHEQRGGRAPQYAGKALKDSELNTVSSRKRKGLELAQ